MSFSFDLDERAVIVRVRIWGPRGRTVVRFALDTGATETLVNWDITVLLGYDPSASPSRERITTGSGVEFAPEISIDRIEAIGMERLQFPVLCHTLPPSAGVDGLLGLDFLRGQRVVLDFRAGTITVD
jgi:predicted aspartyl protease